MKSNLFKKIGAMVTTVAMIASLGTVAFADASITIDDDATSISDPDANNVRTVTVTYNATDVTGEVAVLGYVAKDGAGSETYAAYSETTHTIVGIEQEAVDTTNKTISFKVKDDSSTGQSNVNGKDYLYITLGAQGVDVADTAVIELATEPPVETNWTATQVAFVSDADLSVDVDYGADKAAAALATLKAAAITLGNGTKSVNTTLEALGAVVNYGTPAVSGDVYTYTITFTAGDSGINDTDGKAVLLGTDLTLTKAVTVNEDDAPSGNKVEITSAAAEYDETAGVFDVTVNYTTTGAADSAQVAMMSYIGTIDNEFETDATPDYADEDTMKIIGIAQQTNGENGGTFTYKITGSVGNNSYMVVKLGAQGDRVAPDAIAVQLSTTGTPDEPTVVTATHATIDQIEAADVAAVKLALAGKTATVMNNSAVVGTVALTGEMIDTVAVYDGGTVNGGEFNYKLTIPAGTEVMSGATAVGVIGEGGLTAYLYAETPVITWTVTSGTMDAITVDNIADADDDAEVLAAVKAAIVDKKITLTSGTTGQTAETTVADTWAVAKVDADTYEVTVPANAALANVLPEGADVTMAQIDVKFGVTVNEIPEQPVVLDTASLAANTATVTDAANAEAAVKAINLTIGTYTKTIAEWITAGVVEIAASDNVYTVTVKAGQEVATNVTTGTIAPMTVTVTVQAAPQYMLGDINNNKQIDSRDLTAIMNHLKGKTQIDTNDAQKMFAADINNNKQIDSRDLTAIMNHLKGKTQIVQP